MTITAKIIADSINPRDVRITTFELEYPRYIHCFDEETELLVKPAGGKPQFKKFSEVIGLPNYEVAQVNTASDNFDIDFVKPIAWHEQDYVNEKMVSLDSHQRLNFVVTKGHRMFVGSRKKNGDKKEFILAEELLKDYTQKRFYKTGNLTTCVDYGNDFSKLLAYFICDGTLPLNGKQAIFRFRKKRKIEEVKRLLAVLGFSFDERKCTDGTTNIVFQRADWMEDCYTEQGEKCVPPQFFNMTSENFKHFEQGLLESDGCVANSQFNSFSSQLIEDLCVIFHTHGKSFNIKKYGDCFKVKILKEDAPILRKDKHTVKEIDYTGKVYCVTVPTGAIMVRRAGIVHISGNCEMMTHRMFSRNSASSRAIPTVKVIEQVEKSPAMPIHWGKNQAGMQAKEELDELLKKSVQQLWVETAKEVARHATIMHQMGLHKQVVNRILEPFQVMKVIVTATEYENFWHLRDHPDAQPEIRRLAQEMKKAYNTSTPVELKPGMWHLPYIETEIIESEQVYKKPEGGYYTLDEAIQVSCSCCAQVSYRKLDTSLEKARDIYRKLVESEPVHASAFEHVAKCEDDYTAEGWTHTTRCGSVWSGNFRDWIQYRQLIPNHVKRG